MNPVAKVAALVADARAAIAAGHPPDECFEAAAVALYTAMGTPDDAAALSDFALLWPLLYDHVAGSFAGGVAPSAGPSTDPRLARFAADVKRARVGFGPPETCTTCERRRKGGVLGRWAPGRGHRGRPRKPVAS